MSFRKCQLRSRPSDDCEYSDLKFGSKFVKVKEIHKKGRKLVIDKDKFRNYRDVDLVRSELIISYPGVHGFTDVKPESDKEKYYLVVNHTEKSAFAVLRKDFDKFYSVSKVHKKAKGDSGLDKSAPADPTKDKKKRSHAKHHSK